MRVVLGVVIVLLASVPTAPVPGAARPAAADPPPGGAPNGIGRPAPDSLRDAAPDDAGGERAGLRVLWERDLGRGTTVPAGGDTLYAGTPDRKVVAFDARTGTTRWRASLDGPVDVTPAAGNARVLAFAGGRKPAVYLLDLVTGAEEWKRRRPGPTGGTALLDAGEGRWIACAASLGGEVAGLDLRKGGETWKSRVRTPALAQPLAIDSVLFVATLTDSVARLRIADGRRLASVHAGSAQPSGLLRAGNRACVLTAGGDLLAMDAGGTVLFRSALGGPAAAGLCLSGDTLYAATLAGGVFAVRAEDGAILWRRSFDQSYAAAPVRAFDLLWVGALSGEVRGLDPATGEERARFREDGTIRWLLRTKSGALLLGFEGGGVRALAPLKLARAGAPPG
jgi:outer membrane protein assembly factor BamB